MASSYCPKLCLVVRHLSFEDLGVFESELQEHGFAVTYRQAGVDFISDHEWHHADLVVVLGGPIGVNDVDRYPWLADEIRHISRRLSSSKPLLGVCLGAQLMAAALGARVFAGPRKEIGWTQISLSSAGHKSPLRHLKGVQVLHWHGDTFDMPAEATLLASTDVTPPPSLQRRRACLGSAVPS